jgi:hypothetical protein
LQHGFGVGDGFNSLSHVIAFAIEFFAELSGERRSKLLVYLAKRFPGARLNQPCHRSHAGDDAERDGEE